MNTNIHKLICVNLPACASHGRRARPPSAAPQANAGRVWSYLCPIYYYQCPFVSICG